MRNVVEEDFACLDIKAMARYLYWACFRGDNEVVKYLLEEKGISPFYQIYDSKSPLMASLQGKNRPLKKTKMMNDANMMKAVQLVSNRSQIEICSRSYVYKEDQEFLEQ